MLNQVVFIAFCSLVIACFIRHQYYDKPDLKNVLQFKANEIVKLYCSKKSLTS
jgi:hypothetical protein